MYTKKAPRIETDQIRRQFDASKGKWYFSIVDAVGIVAKTSDARNYWKVLKSRLKKTHNELVTECNQLKMPSSDGKFYLTDVGDKETILKVISLVSEKHIHHFEDYFDNLTYKNEVKIIKDKEQVDALAVSQNDTYPQFKNRNNENDDEEFMLMIDGYCEKNIITVKAFVAGVDMQSIFVSVNEKILTIKGRRKIEKDNKNKNYLHEELYWGKFSRSIELPSEVEINKIETLERDGLLVIKLPMITHIYKKEKIKMRTI